MIRQHHSSRLAPDEISEILGDRRFAERAYFPELRDRILGRHSTQLVGVSRHYLLLKPQVVVDFEPSPLDGKFYVDEKRAFFIKRGILYIPIFLGERLTSSQFLERLRQERLVMEQGRKEAGENDALARAHSAVPAQLESEALDLDRLALRQLRAEIGENTFLRGASKAKRLVAIRRSLALS